LQRAQNRTNKRKENDMNLNRLLVTGGLTAMLCTAGNGVMAQQDNGGDAGGGGRRRGGANFDPAQMQQRMMDNVRDQMGVTNNDEWQVLETRVQKVFEARRDAGPPGFGRMFRGRQGDNNGGGGGRRGGMFGGTPMPELEALNNAIDSNVPTEQIKAAMDKYRAARKVKEAALEKAQQDLKSILTVKQEAVAVSLGLLN
jgi:hypothetical protein